ncbi:MAG TPA: NrfD/PsrC family molybdoenzyme membrane anchor subunit [Acidobacteriota bacterium]|nr:NrfD/PsrC family molybdoenzyme membrane anchor subunit [Acidobacteriota bacterium]
MDSTQLLYDIHNGETFGTLIAIYFYLTGLSAGSFIISTLSYGFGFERFKPLGKIGVVIATLLLVAAPLFLLAHSGQKLRVWHLFVYLRFTSPITWGSFLLILYPINCLIYGFFMFKGRKQLTRIFGLTGIPLALMVHGYTGFILAFGKARPLWNSSIMPLLFLVSAIVSGIAMMIIVSVIRDRFFTKEHKIDRDVLSALAGMLSWCLVFDLFLTACEVVVHSISHLGAQESTALLLTGSFAGLYLVLENLIGKVLPLTVVFLPWTRRSVPLLVIASILVMIGIYTMRYNVVVGGEYIPLL